MICPKCGAESGDDWSQCQESCPLPGTPHYKPEPPFHAGDRIKLIQMFDDHCPVEPGTRGVVTRVASFQSDWQICVNWENGRTLALIVPPDRAEKI